MLTLYINIFKVIISIYLLYSIWGIVKSLKLTYIYVLWEWNSLLRVEKHVNAWTSTLAHILFIANRFTLMERYWRIFNQFLQYECLTGVVLLTKIYKNLVVTLCICCKFTYGPLARVISSQTFWEHYSGMTSFWCSFPYQKLLSPSGQDIGEKY